VDKKVFFAPSRLPPGGVNCRAAARHDAKICVNLRNLWIKKSPSRRKGI